MLKSSQNDVHTYLKVPLHKGDQEEDYITWSANLKVAKIQLLFKIHSPSRLCLAAMHIAILSTGSGRMPRMPSRRKIMGVGLAAHCGRGGGRRGGGGR